MKQIGVLLMVVLALVMPAQAIAQDSTGLVRNSEAAYEGYTLFAPLAGTSTYLIDNQGRLVHEWTSDTSPGNSVYLLEDGTLLRTGRVQSQTFNQGGAGGKVQLLAWDSTVRWEYVYADATVHAHHDVEVLPNGNILMIAWELKSAEQVAAAGRDPNLTARQNQQSGGGDGRLWADHLIEVNPQTNEIVWEWHVWDHLVQDYDSSLPDYGAPVDNPGRIDINYPDRNMSIDWNHINSVDYNPVLDQIVLSVHTFNEIWIIDHSLSTEEAAGPAGDLLYRWGNPAAYGASGEQQLFAQHDARWIEPGSPGEGNILIFNNGDRQTRPYSSVEEIAPPLNADGTYRTEEVTPVWSYEGDFFAQNISGSQRLPNGNTLICNGPAGQFIEVMADGTVVWEYINPQAVSRGDAVMRNVFRAERYALDYAGLAGRDLTPGEPIPETVLSGPGGQGQGPNGGPNNGQGQGPGNPPQAALDACAGLGAGDACSFSGQRGEISGSCISPGGGDLVCMPGGRR